MTKNKKTAAFSLLLLMCFFIVTLKAAGEEFVYIHQPGDRYRILSVVNEEVYFNRQLHHRAEILNRIAVEVTDVVNGRGRHRAIFQTSERASQVSTIRGSTGVQSGFEWSREYDSEFERDRLGYLTIDPKYFMPVVRNVPVFPGRELRTGETWSADGYEMHDFRDSFGIEQPYRIPFTAFYTFLGYRQWKGKTYPAFSVKYSIVSRPPAVRGYIWPRSITGFSDQIVYWDIENGRPVAYEETFSFLFELSDGTTVEYRGWAQAEIIESEPFDRDRVSSEITEEIERLEIPNVNVRTVDEGVSISLENIGFYADSAVMLPGEREKLDLIAEILKRYPDRDIMVSGHTALAGTSESRMNLSIDRARAVTDYLLSRQVRSADRIVIRGYGADMPIADNNTEEGRGRNRRVEITILEN